jgi:hypothetical protein
LKKEYENSLIGRGKIKEQLERESNALVRIEIDLKELEHKIKLTEGYWADKKKQSMKQELEAACAFEKLKAGQTTSNEIESALRNFIKKYPRDRMALKAYEYLVTLYRDYTEYEEKVLPITIEAFGWLHDLVKSCPEYYAPAYSRISNNVIFPPVLTNSEVFYLIGAFISAQPTKDARRDVIINIAVAIARMNDTDFLRVIKFHNYLGWEQVDLKNDKELKYAFLKIKGCLINEVIGKVSGFMDSFLSESGKEQYSIMQRVGPTANILLTKDLGEKMESFIRLATSGMNLCIKTNLMSDTKEAKALELVKHLIELGDISAYANVIQCLENKEQLETALECVQAMAKYVVLDDNKKRVRFLPLLNKLQQDQSLSAELKEKVKATIEYITPYEQ